MAPSESFDPRTWRRRDPAASTTPVIASKPAEAARGAGPGEARYPVGTWRWWLGPALSAAILAGGALAAYETRDAAPAAQAVASAR